MFENPLEQVNKFNSYLAKQMEEEKQRKLKQQAYNEQQKQALSPTFSKKMIDASDWQQYESAGIRPLTAKEKMNINVPYSKSEKFPTLTKQDENFIMQQAGGDSVKATDVYKLFMESKSARDFINAREGQRNELAYKASQEKDPETKSRYELIIKGSQLADIARKERLKEGFNDVSQVNDEQILTNLLKTPEAQEGFTKYINNQISLDDMTEIIDPGYTTRNKPVVETNVDNNGIPLKGAARVSPVDLGKREWLNPVGRLAELLDNATQKIPQMNFDEKFEQKIANLPKEKIAEYQAEYNKLDAKKKAKYGSLEGYVRNKETTFWNAITGAGEEGFNAVEMFANIPGSAAKTATATLRGITNPVDTIAGLARLVATEEGRQSLIDRYGSLDNLMNTIENDPVGVASDVLTITQGATGLASKGAKMGGFTNAATKLADWSDTAGAAANLGMDIPYTAAMKAIDVGVANGSNVARFAKIITAPTRPLEITKQITKKTLTRTVPEKVIETEMGLTPRERSKVEETGITAGNFMLKNKLASLDTEGKIAGLQQLADEQYNGITKKFNEIGENVGVSDPAFNKMLAIMSDEMSSSSIVKNEYADYIAKIDAMKDQNTFSAQEGLAIRRDFDIIVGKKIFDAKGRVSGLEDEILAGYRAKANDVLQKVGETYGLDMKDMNTTLRNAITIRDGLIRSASQSKKNNYFSLQDLGVGTVGAVVTAGNPIATLGIFAGKKALEKNAGKIAQGLYDINKAPLETKNIKKGAGFINKGEDAKRLNLLNRNDSNTADLKGQTLRVETQPSPKGKAPEGAKTATSTKTVDKVLPIEEDTLMAEARKYKTDQEFIDSKLEAKANLFLDKIQNIGEVQNLRHKLHSLDSNDAFYASESGDYGKYSDYMEGIKDNIAEIKIVGNEGVVVDKLDSILSEMDDIDSDYFNDIDPNENYNKWYKKRDKSVSKGTELKEKANNIIEGYLNDLEEKYQSEGLEGYYDSIDNYRGANGFSPSGWKRARSILGEGADNIPQIKQFEKGKGMKELRQIREDANKK